MIVEVYFKDCEDGSFELIGVENNRSYGCVWPQLIDPFTAQLYLDD